MWTDLLSRTKKVQRTGFPNTSCIHVLWSCCVFCVCHPEIECKETIQPEGGFIFITGEFCQIHCLSILSWSSNNTMLNWSSGWNVTENKAGGIDRRAWMEKQKVLYLKVSLQFCHIHYVTIYTIYCTHPHKYIHSTHHSAEAKKRFVTTLQMY